MMMMMSFSIRFVILSIRLFSSLTKKDPISMSPAHLWKLGLILPRFSKQIVHRQHKPSPLDHGDGQVMPSERKLWGSRPGAIRERRCHFAYVSRKVSPHVEWAATPNHCLSSSMYRAKAPRFRGRVSANDEGLSRRFFCVMSSSFIGKMAIW